MTLEQNVSKTRDDIRYIVIHHTATDNNVTAEDVLASMQKRYWEPVPTHYIVDANWTVLNPVPITEPAGWFSTKNWGLTLDDAIKLNWQSIHIEVVGTWTDTENPAQLPKAQEDALRNLVAELQAKYPASTVTAHSLIDRNKWSCWQAIVRTLAEEPKVEQTTQPKSKWINISLSRYYSVMPNQTSYYWGRTYEEDFKINCSGDPMVTSDWHQLNDNEWWKVVACPKDIKLWTKLYIEWIWEVTCHDRWWKIIKQWDTYRIDMWMWQWQAWLDRIMNNAIRWWNYRWYVIK